MKKTIRIIVQDITNFEKGSPAPELYRDYEVDTEMLEPEFDIADMLESLVVEETKF